MGARLELIQLCKEASPLMKAQESVCQHVRCFADAPYLCYDGAAICTVTPLGAHLSTEATNVSVEALYARPRQSCIVRWVQKDGFAGPNTRSIGRANSDRRGDVEARFKT